MITIQRTTIPTVLSTSRAHDRYRNPKVVKSLWLMQHKKCCYCETYIPDYGPNKQVEHFRPQSRYENLKNEWDNLLLSCGTCNNSKLDAFPTTLSGDPLLLDPSDSSIEPEEHIGFAVGDKHDIKLPLGLAVCRNGSKRGAQTIQTIRLHNEYYVRLRARLLNQMWWDYYRLRTELEKQRAGCGNLVEIARLKRSLRNRMDDDQEHAAAARAFCRKMNLEKHGVSR